MGPCADLGYESQRDASHRYLLAAGPQTFDRLFDKANLINGINIDRIDSGAHRIINLIVRLARTIEDDLVWPKPDLKCLEELSAAVNFHVDPRFEHCF